MRIQLGSGAYTTRSVVSSAQRQLNLYSEPGSGGSIIDIQTGPEGEALSGGVKGGLMALYPTPGLRLLTTIPQGPIRGLHSATNGTLYVVAGNGVYTVQPTSYTQTATQDWNAVFLFPITAGLTTPVSMADNGLVLVIVDGSTYGWTVNLANDAFASIVDPTGAFRGADRVDYLDTFFLFNAPGTPQFYSSQSEAVTFDPLDFAGKTSASDLLVTLIVAKREIWLLGSKTTEVWYDAGAVGFGALVTNTFPFASMPGVFIDQGCIAKYSVASLNNTVYWLGADRYGQGMVIAGAGYQSTRISTAAMEFEFTRYSTLTDAVGYTYTLAGHLFYVLTFPAADKTWAFDFTTKLWHELAWIDGNGTEHRHRVNCATYAYATVVAGDWENGNLYALDLAAITDNGAPIKRLRSFPHLIADGKRVFYRQFLADMESGNPGGDVPVLAPAVAFNREDGGLILREDSGDLMREQTEAGVTSGQVSLCWSDDRGHHYGNPITQDLGATGDYLTSVQFQRLGMGRDRVFALSWSLPTATVLQGAWIEVEPAQS